MYHSLLFLMNRHKHYKFPREWAEQHPSHIMMIVQLHPGIPLLSEHNARGGMCSTNTVDCVNVGDMRLDVSRLYSLMFLHRSSDRGVCVLCCQAVELLYPVTSRPCTFQVPARTWRCVPQCAKGHVLGEKNDCDILGRSLKPTHFL